MRNVVGLVEMDAEAMAFRDASFDIAVAMFTATVVPAVRIPCEHDMMDFSIWIEAPGVVTKQHVNHDTEAHHAWLKARASMTVIRAGEVYEPGIDVIVARIMSARQVWEGPR